MVGGFFYLAENLADSIDTVRKQLTHPETCNEDMSVADFKALKYILDNTTTCGIFDAHQKHRLANAIDCLLRSDIPENPLNRTFMNAVKKWRKTFPKEC